MSDEAIRIECPGCHRKFRMRSRGSSGRTAVKCPKCATRIPLGGPPQLPPSPTRPAQPSGDAELRRKLLRAKKKRTTGVGKNRGAADSTIPDLPVSVDDTAPDYGGQTMPMGRSALTASELGTDRRGAETLQRRKRLDTPRLAAMVPAPQLRPPEPPANIERPVVDEPTYTGPMPGRTPQITPSGSDLSRFLEPGNYLVRIEDVVYEPVTEKVLAKVLNAGVFFAIDELRPEGSDWVRISSPELFSDLRGRLAHRAHHILARVVPGQPASDFGRPPPFTEPEPRPSQIATEPSVSRLETEPVSAEPTSAPELEKARPPKKKRRLWLAVFPMLFILFVAAAGSALLLTPGLQERARALLVGEAVLEEPDLGDATLAVLAEEDAGEIDQVPAFQSAAAAVVSAHAVADSIEGQLLAAQELGDETATVLLAFEKWKRHPQEVDARTLLERLRASKNWRAARQVANWLIVVEDGSETKKKLREFVTASLRKQIEDQKEIEITTEDYARIVRVDPGHRPAIVIADHSGELWTIWPDLGERNWRNDIAVYRLCELMVCHFRVPETRSMRIDKTTFKKLAKAADDTSREMANNLRSDFAWSKKGVLQGSIRAVPGGASWPIELSQIWRPWLTAGSGLAQLENDVEEAHQTMAFFNAERVYPEVHGMKARQLARQVSSVLLVDYLVNNWNRFAPTEENWGSRTRIDAGLVHSVEDSAAFLGDSSVRVKGRFSWSKRFSRATIDSLRGLDADEVGEFLFPSPTKADKEKLETLWSQRSRALRRIKKLVKRYGAEDVYALDGQQ